MKNSILISIILVLVLLAVILFLVYLPSDQPCTDELIKIVRTLNYTDTLSSDNQTSHMRQFIFDGDITEEEFNKMAQDCIKSMS